MPNFAIQKYSKIKQYIFWNFNDWVIPIIIVDNL